MLAPAETYRGKQNSENPELYAIFPYRVYGVGKPDFEVALRTFEVRGHKGTGGWQQNAIQSARLGLAEEARSMVSQNASRVASGFRFPVMWGPNFNWIPDQDHGSVTVLALAALGSWTLCKNDAIRTPCQITPSAAPTSARKSSPTPTVDDAIDVPIADTPSRPFVPRGHGLRSSLAPLG